MSQDSGAERKEVEGEARESDEADARDEAARENRRVPAGCLNISIEKLGVQKYAQILLNYMNYREAKGRQVKEQEGLHRDLEMLTRYLRSEMSEDEKNQRKQELQSILQRLYFSSQEVGEAEESYRSALEQEEEESSAENKDENASDEVPSERPTSPKKTQGRGLQRRMEIRQRKQASVRNKAWMRRNTTQSTLAAKARQRPLQQRQVQAKVLMMSRKLQKQQKQEQKWMLQDSPLSMNP
jgi:hypothetical protein